MYLARRLNKPCRSIPLTLAFPDIVPPAHVHFPFTRTRLRDAPPQPFPPSRSPLSVPHGGSTPPPADSSDACTVSVGGGKRIIPPFSTVRSPVTDVDEIMFENTKVPLSWMRVGRNNGGNGSGVTGWAVIRQNHFR